MPADRREQFGQLLREAAAKRGITRQLHLRQTWNARYPTEPLSTANATQWWNGNRIPVARSVAMLADIVGLPRDQMLAAAGHADTADPAAPSPGEWARWVEGALAETGWSPEQLAQRAAIPTETVAGWLAERAAPPDADTATDLAELTGRDGVGALLAAGHRGVAKFAAALRDGPRALIDHEMETIEQDDPWLDRIAAAARRGLITRAEHDRMRAAHLQRKQDSIRLIEADYEAALRRTEAEGAQRNGDNGHAAL